VKNGRKREGGGGEKQENIVNYGPPYHIRRIKHCQRVTVIREMNGTVVGYTAALQERYSRSSVQEITKGERMGSGVQPK
jgi:hypothetical protein